MKQTNKPRAGEKQAQINPSYDNSLLPERRLYDFLGKYYINLNGVIPNNHPEITEPHKKEIVDFVLMLIDQVLSHREEEVREEIRGKIIKQRGIGQMIGEKVEDYISRPRLLSSLNEKAEKVRGEK